MNNRVQTIKSIFEAHPDAFFVLSNGLTSREAAHFLRNDRSFYMLHAMGEALSVGIGLAQSCPDLEVVVIDGDGNALMGMSSWSMMNINNLRYYIIANRTYETTGYQPVPPFPCLPSWCKLMHFEPGKEDTPNPPSPGGIWRKTQAWLKRTGNHF